MTKVKIGEVEPHICHCKEYFASLDLRSGELMCLICDGNIPVEILK